MNIFLTYATNSAFASDPPDFPLEPVYLLIPIPLPKYDALFFSDTDAYIGSNPASTSADNILELQNTFSNKFGLLQFNLFSISEINVSNTCDSIPVFPILPISSLSDIIQTAVLFVLSISISAVKDVYTHILSSCPYAATKLLSNPILFALKAGTNSISELKKSTSVIPYFSFNIFNIFNFTFSLTSSVIFISQNFPSG